MRRPAAAVLAFAVAVLAAAPARAAELSAPRAVPAVSLAAGPALAAPTFAALPGDASALWRRPSLPSPALPAPKSTRVDSPAHLAPENARPVPPRAAVVHGAGSPDAHAGAAGLSRLELSALDAAGALRPGLTAAASSALAGKTFDGSFAAPDPEQGAWLASVVAEAARSRAGRAILGRVRSLAERRGRPVIVVVAPIGNAGEYAFDHEVVTMDAGHKARPPVEAAPVFLHELAHVLQLAQGLPVDAFEMELEAYLIQFRVADELGVKPRRGTFHWSALRRFRNDVDRFMAWLLAEYDGNLAITGKGSLAGYESQLEQRRSEAAARLERLEKRAASKRRVVEKMVATGQPARLIAEYRLDELAPLEEKLRLERRELGWLERDLLLLRGPESRERYRRYAQRVLRKARAYHDRLVAGIAGSRP